MESFHIKPDQKLFSRSRSVSKESSISHPSFRVYYGDVSGAVPFTWESRPGTPKHPLFPDSNLPPPLTPPPSYYHHSTEKSMVKSTTSKHKPPRSRSNNLLRYMFAGIKLAPSRPHLITTSRSSSLSLSSSSPSYSSFSSCSSSEGRRRRFSSCGSSFDDGGGDIDEHQQVANGGSRSSLKCSRYCFPLR